MSERGSDQDEAFARDQLMPGFGARSVDGTVGADDEEEAPEADSPVCASRGKPALPTGNKVSVVMPVFNAREHLSQAIESVLSQDLRDIELVLVDDGSTDGSGELCEEIAGRDARVIVEHRENGGPAAARNAGLERVSGDWIAFVDADDWVEPDYFSQMLSLAREERANLVVGDCVMEEPEGTRRFGMVVPDMSYESKTDLFQDFLSERIPWSLWAKLLAADLLKGIQFEEDDFVAEDLDVFSRIIVKDGLNLITTGLAGYHYRVEGGSVDHSFTRRHLGQLDVFERVAGRMREQRAMTATSPEVFYEERVLNCWRKAIDADALGDEAIVKALNRACALHRGDVLHDPNAPGALKRRLRATYLGPRVYAKLHNAIK